HRHRAREGYCSALTTRAGELFRMFRLSPRQRLCRRLKAETVIAKEFLQSLDPSPDQGSGFVRAGNIERLAVAAELKEGVARVRVDVAEYPLHGRKVRVRRETNRL